MYCLHLQGDKLVQADAEVVAKKLRCQLHWKIVKNLADMSYVRGQDRVSTKPMGVSTKSHFKGQHGGCAGEQMSVVSL